MPLYFQVGNNLRVCQRFETARVPDNARWIPRAMSVNYLAKAKSDLRGVSSGEGIDWSTAGEKLVPVEVFDTDGQKVFTAEITMNVKLG